MSFFTKYELTYFQEILQGVKTQVATGSNFDFRLGKRVNKKIKI